MAQLKKNISKYILAEIVLQMNYGCKLNQQYDKKNMCYVCYDSMENTYVLETPCDHHFHIDCVLAAIVEHRMFRCLQCSKPFDFQSNDFIPKIPPVNNSKIHNKVSYDEKV